VERVADGATAHAKHTRSDPALASAHRRHRPLPKLDLDLEAAGLDQDRRRGKPREQGAGYPLWPFHRRRSPFRDRSHGQARVIADEAAIGMLIRACSDTAHSGEILFWFSLKRKAVEVGVQAFTLSRFVSLVSLRER